MVEKKYSRISVRVPPSWKRTCAERGISISYVTRAALYQAMQQTEIVLGAGSKLRSQQRAASLFNALKPFFVRTVTPEINSKLRESAFKTILFRQIFLPLALPEEVIILGEFLDQQEFAEEILGMCYDES